MSKKHFIALADAIREHNAWANSPMAPLSQPFTWTRGPWACEEARSSDWELSASGRECSYRLYANDPGPDTQFTIGFISDVDEPTRIANARLISKAPEMAEAIELVLADKNIGYLALATVNKLAAAIRAAKGDCEP